MPLILQTLEDVTVEVKRLWDQLDLLRESSIEKLIARATGVETEESGLSRAIGAFLPADMIGNTEAFNDFFDKISLKRSFGDNAGFTPDFIAETLETALDNSYFQNSRDGKRLFMMIRDVSHDFPLLDDSGNPVTIDITDLNVAPKRQERAVEDELLGP